MRFVTKAIKISYFRHFSMGHLQSGKRECIHGVQHCKHSLQYAIYRVQPLIQSGLNFMSTGTCMHCERNVIIFQCTCPVSQMEFTADIFTHHCKLTLPDIKCHLRGFVNTHMKWIVQVGTNILKKKGINIYDYVNDLVELAIPSDQLGLLILARTYHCHITVFCKDYVWTTRSDNSMREKGKQGIQKEKSVICHLTRYCNNTGVRIEKRKTLKVQIMKLLLQLKGLEAQI